MQTAGAKALLEEVDAPSMSRTRVNLLAFLPLPSSLAYVSVLSVSFKDVLIVHVGCELPKTAEGDPFLLIRCQGNGTFGTGGE